MRNLILISLAFTLLLSCKKQETEAVEQSQNTDELVVDEIYRPLIHHFSSTGCGPCGRWGIPTLDRVAELMGDSIVPLITHFKYNDPFITPSSTAIENGFLNEWYSPQIWIDNEDRTFPFIYDEIETAAKKYSDVLRSKIKSKAEAYVACRYSLNANDRYDIDIAVQNNNNDSAEFFVEVYAMEDNIEASQAGADPFVMMHQKVNRGGFYGDMGKRVKLAAGERFDESVEFIPCWVCNPKEQYFYVMVWKEVSPGRFEYVNGMVRR